MRSSFVAFNLCLLFSLLISPNANANVQTKTIRYFGEARKDDQIIYREFHEVTYSPRNKLLKSKTEYKAPEGGVLCSLDSDYTLHSSAPTHTVFDYQTEEYYGIRYENNELVMFHKYKDASEKTKKIDASSKDQTLVAAQGLNYFILENIEVLESKENIPFTFLIPGRLDEFNFVLKKVNQPSDESLDLELKVKSFWLKFFAPKMLLKYDKIKKRLVYYKGLSNIRDKNGDRQVVEITYSYNN
jgi:hypothetical protein